MLAHPQHVEFLDQRIQQFPVIRQNAGLPIPAVIIFGAYARAGQVCAAQIGEPAIDHHRLCVQSRAQISLK